MQSHAEDEGAEGALHGVPDGGEAPVSRCSGEAELPSGGLYVVAGLVPPGEEALEVGDVWSEGVFGEEVVVDSSGELGVSGVLLGEGGFRVVGEALGEDAGVGCAARRPRVPRGEHAADVAREPIELFVVPVAHRDRFAPRHRVVVHPTGCRYERCEVRVEGGGEVGVFLDPQPIHQPVAQRESAGGRLRRLHGTPPGRRRRRNGGGAPSVGEVNGCRRGRAGAAFGGGVRRKGDGPRRCGGGFSSRRPDLRRESEGRLRRKRGGWRAEGRVLWGKARSRGGGAGRCGRNGPERTGIGLLRAATGPQRTLIGPECARIGPERANVRFERPVIGPECARIGPEHTIIEPDRARIGPERAIIEPERTRIAPEVAMIEPERTRNGSACDDRGPDGRGSVPNARTSGSNDL